MKRHKKLWLETYNNEGLEAILSKEMHEAKSKYGRYNSMHEAYAVIKEELEEFWDGVKIDDPDPYELLQVCATSKRALIELCQSARREMNELT